MSMCLGGESPAWLSPGQEGEPRAPYLSLVFRLQAQPGLHAPPRLQEGLALGPVRQVADGDPRRVHAHEQHRLGHHLQRAHTWSAAQEELFGGREETHKHPPGES